MRRGLLVVVAMVGAVCLGSSSTASAQDGFTANGADVGGVISVGGLAGAGTGFGGRFEMGVKELPGLGNGILGIGVAVDRYSWDFGNAFASASGSYMPVSVTANYHFHLQNKKIDPFLGVGLGDLHVHESCSVAGFDCGSLGSASSGIYFVGHAGIRYYLSSKLALYADAGSGFGNLHVGVVFKVK